MDYQKSIEKIGEFGIVEEVFTPIVVASGLPGARVHEIVIFENGEMGEIFVMEETKVQILSFAKDPIIVGTKVTRRGEFLSIGVGQELLGEMITPLGLPISKKETLKRLTEARNLDIGPKGISERKRVTKPFLTGVTIVDSMVPLGQGQKELIIGDRKTGKTSFLLATMKNQIKMGTIVIYAAIAKRKSDIKKVKDFLQKENLLKNSIIVGTSSYDSPSLIYLTPFTAMTIAEYFCDSGKNVLVVMDDLSTHARFYREFSLLAKRFPGRDSYPGDIFYTHARLMERSGNFKLPNGGEASITMLPVAETVEGDLTGYITTNLMSMTDGHIFFDSNIYYEGRRPAVNIPLSVTRVGRQTQSELSRNITSTVSAFLTGYEKVLNLSHFGAELSDEVKGTLATGQAIYTFFNQHFDVSIPLAIQSVIFALLWLGLMDTTSEGLSSAKKKLVEAYGNTAVKPLFDSAFSTKSFNELLEFVKAHQEEFGRIAK
jgi:F-type H+-transporting ATPase subunit alpha